MSTYVFSIKSMQLTLNCLFPSTRRILTAFVSPYLLKNSSNFFCRSEVSSPNPFCSAMHEQICRYLKDLAYRVDASLKLTLRLLYLSATPRIFAGFIYFQLLTCP